MYRTSLEGQMYDPFKDYTEVNPSKRDKPGFLGRVKKFLYDPEVEGEAMKELFKKATDYLSPSSFRATEYSEENPSLNESSRSYSKKLKNLGKWLWRNKWKIVIGGLIAGGLTFLNRITYTVRPAGGIPESWGLKLTLNPILNPITYLLGEGEVLFAGLDGDYTTVRVYIGDELIGIFKNTDPFDLIRSYVTKSILRHLPLYIAIGEAISFGIPYLWKKSKKTR